jgi:hypothetical protein
MHRPASDPRVPPLKHGACSVAPRAMRSATSSSEPGSGPPGSSELPAPPLPISASLCPFFPPSVRLLLLSLHLSSTPQPLPHHPIPIPVPCPFVSCVPDHPNSKLRGGGQEPSRLRRVETKGPQEAANPGKPGVGGRRARDARPTVIRPRRRHRAPSQHVVPVIAATAVGAIDPRSPPADRYGPEGA